MGENLGMKDLNVELLKKALFSTIEELMELDQDDTKSDEAEKSKNIKDFFAKKWKDLLACMHFQFIVHILI